MSYIKFDKGQVVNLEYSLKRGYCGRTAADLIPAQQLSDAIPVSTMAFSFVRSMLSEVKGMSCSHLSMLLL